MSAKKKTVYVVYYSMYGHVAAMAKSVVKGLEKSGVNVKLFQIAETLGDEVLGKMHAPPKAADVPVIQAAQLKDADGIVWGVPTRFGMVPAQVKALMDQCGQMWMSGALANKFTGVFFSTGAQGGGQEMTALTMMPFLAGMGLIYVPFGGKTKLLGNNEEIHGGSAFGAGTVAITGRPGPSNLELEMAEAQGLDFGTVVRRTMQ